MARLGPTQCEPLFKTIVGLFGESIAFVGFLLQVIGITNRSGPKITQTTLRSISSALDVRSLGE